MKKNIAFRLCFATAVFVATMMLSAQQAAPSAASGKNMTEEQVNDANIQLMRQDIRSERKKVVAANMPLTDTEATKFWPVYDQYISETIKVNEDRKIWRIDFTRAFRLSKDLKNPKNLEHCDRQLFKRLKTLDGNELSEKTKHYLTKDEVKAVMTRRDKIVTQVQKLISEKGENEVLY